MVGSTGKLASSSDLDRSLTFGDVAGVDQAKSQVQVGAYGVPGTRPYGAIEGMLCGAVETIQQYCSPQ